MAFSEPTKKEAYRRSGGQATIYRLLRDGGAAGERRRQAAHPARTVPELVATRPNEVWSYDVTKLKGPSRGVHYDLFVMLDMFSRCCPGWMVVDQEDAQVAKAWLAEVAASQHIAPGTLTVHADRGSSMTSKPVAVLLADLKIGRTHSRPHVSNHNPYTEAGFKTLKYCPAFPGRFGSRQDAIVFCEQFFTHYNKHHRHSGIGLYTPASVHYGTAPAIRAQRAVTVDAACKHTPSGSSTRRPHRRSSPAWHGSRSQRQTRTRRRIFGKLSQKLDGFPVARRVNRSFVVEPIRCVALGPHGWSRQTCSVVTLVSCIRTQRTSLAGRSAFGDSGSDIHL